MNWFDSGHASLAVKGHGCNDQFDLAVFMWNRDERTIHILDVYCLWIPWPECAPFIEETNRHEIKDAALKKRAALANVFSS